MFLAVYHPVMMHWDVWRGNQETSCSGLSLKQYFLSFLCTLQTFCMHHYFMMQVKAWIKIINLRTKINWNKLLTFKKAYGGIEEKELVELRHGYSY